ncbi:RNA polymerase sigma factor [Spirosoma sp. SC4-14]|uniref:RNA polymerase sigma factor n=1 Tax=Spirosoma sp. SC4-14 TaxID=3128900 RepID=UPI0030D49106
MNDVFTQATSSDFESWRAVKHGDPEALSRLFLCYYDELFSYGYRLLSDEDFVKDCLQDLFLKVWQRREAIGDVREIRPYLFKSMRRCIIDGLRANHNRFRLWTEDDERYLEITFSHEDFLISQQIDQQQREQLTNALNKLTKREREAIHLRYFENFSPATIALIMDMKEQSVYNLLHRAMQSLRDNFFLLLLVRLSLLN